MTDWKIDKPETVTYQWCVDEMTKVMTSNLGSFQKDQVLAQLKMMADTLALRDKSKKDDEDKEALVREVRVVFVQPDTPEQAERLLSIDAKIEQTLGKKGVA